MSRTADQSEWRRRKRQGRMVARVEIPAAREAELIELAERWCREADAAAQTPAPAPPAEPSCP